MSSLEINLNLSATVQQPFAPSSAGLASNRDKDKYPVDDIKDPTPCTVMYVKGSISSSIEVVKATVMPSCILHGEPIPIVCSYFKHAEACSNPSSISDSSPSKCLRPRAPGEHGEKATATPRVTDLLITFIKFLIKDQIRW
jgi:hypothetical protein